MSALRRLGEVTGALHLAFTESWAVMLAQDTARRRELRQLEAQLFASFSAAGLEFGTLPLKRYELLRREGIAPWFFDWLAHPTRDEYWERWSIERRHENVRVPALHIAGWYDIFLDGSIRNYEGLRERAADDRARTGQRIVIGPWHHVPWAPIVSGWDFGAEARSGGHLNSNSATSNFGVYEIEVDGQLYKIGKADLNRVTQASGSSASWSIFPGILPPATSASVTCSTTARRLARTAIHTRGSAPAAPP